MVLFQIDIHKERDIVIARQMARTLSREMNFGIVDQTRIITVVSELTRNIIDYAERGELCISKEEFENKPCLTFSFIDNGPGIEDINLAMKEGYSSGKGLGLGLSGCKKLMDEFFIESFVGKGTKIVVKKSLKR